MSPSQTQAVSVCPIRWPGCKSLLRRSLSRSRRAPRTSLRSCRQAGRAERSSSPPAPRWPCNRRFCRSGYFTAPAVMPLIIHRCGQMKIANSGRTAITFSGDAGAWIAAASPDATSRRSYFRAASTSSFQKGREPVHASGQWPAGDIVVGSAGHRAHDVDRRRHPRLPRRATERRRPRGDPRSSRRTGADVWPTQLRWNSATGLGSTQDAASRHRCAPRSLARHSRLRADNRSASGGVRLKADICHAV